MRKAFINTLVKQALRDDNIWLLVADVGYGLVEPFRDKFPDRFVNVGIAEQNMIGVATGLAMSGKTVFCYSLANFPTFRCLEQIRNDICYHEANVKIVSAGAGLSYGALGSTHHAIEDVAIMRALPNIAVVSPCDPIEAALATKAISEFDIPCYLRLSRDGDPIIHNDIPEFMLGSAMKLKDGGSTAIIGYGSIMSEVMKAAGILNSRQFYPQVWSFPTIKPLDIYTISKFQRIIVVEEHSLIGGLGSAVAERIADSGSDTKLMRIGIDERFCTEIGSQQYIREKNGLTAKLIADRIVVYITEGLKAHNYLANSYVARSGEVRYL